tara:strand:- start:3754 stop:4125 length:372 start_codon:yes stop_codon:yes gene_type:complete
MFISAIVLISSCEELLEVPDISGEEVTLLAPSDSTVVTQAIVNFTWNEVFEAKSYHIQVAQPSFLEASQIVVDTLVVVDSTYVGTRFTKTLINNGYEWRVKALNSDFETEYTTHSFTVQITGN